MPDKFDMIKRSQIMRKVKNRDTGLELTIRKLLNIHGYRYRLKHDGLPCNPDIIFPGRKKVIFINGCFWHGHGCKRGTLPKTNKDFWEEKISKNKERDKKNYEAIKRIGWDYLVIWQCEVSKNKLHDLLKKIILFLD